MSFTKRTHAAVRTVDGASLRRAKIGVILGTTLSTLVVAQTAPPPPPSPTPITEPPVVKLEADAVTVERTTLSGSTVVFGVARRSLEFGERLETRFDLLEDIDKDGAVRYEVGEGVPWKSVWTAVDLASGQFSLIVPEGFPLMEVEFPGNGLGSALKTLETAGDFEQLLWVRPGLGAWTLTVGDGGVNDGDREGNHRILADVSLFTAMGKSPAAPEKFAAGDVLVGVEAHTLNVFAARLAH